MIFWKREEKEMFISGEKKIGRESHSDLREYLRVVKSYSSLGAVRARVT